MNVLGAGENEHTQAGAGFGEDRSAEDRGDDDVGFGYSNAHCHETAKSPIAKFTQQPRAAFGETFFASICHAEFPTKSRVSIKWCSLILFSFGTSKIVRHLLRVLLFNVIYHSFNTFSAE